MTPKMGSVTVCEISGLDRYGDEALTTAEAKEVARLFRQRVAEEEARLQQQGPADESTQ
jgi:hypothetical protein